jgi:hypothetical protein
MEVNMNNFKADFNMVNEVVKDVDFDSLCEHIYANEIENFNGELVFKKRLDNQTLQVTFRFSPEFEGYDDEEQLVEEQLGWIYRGCKYEEYTRTKSLETTYDQ